MTPRTYWDQDFVLWEQHPDQPELIRWVWSPFVSAPHGTNTWVRRDATAFLGLVLVASC